MASIHYCMCMFCFDHIQLEDNSGEFAVGLLKELARAYLTATSSDNTRAQVS